VESFSRNDHKKSPEPQAESRAGGYT